MSHTDLHNIWHQRQEAGGPPDHPGFRMKNLTTADRDALSDAGARNAPKAGDWIFNTTTGTFQGFDGTDWLDMPGLPPDTVGEAGAATVVATEHGNAVHHITKLELTDFVVNATEPDNGDFSIGALVYTLPAGAYVIEHASFHGSFLKAGEATIGDGEIGIGTLIGTGTEDALGDVGAAAENVCGPVTISNGEFDGAAVFAGVSAPNLYIAATGGLARALFLNVAATWPNVTPAGGITFTGVITVAWRKID